MPPLALSDEEMTVIRTAAEAVPHAWRDDFLRKVASALANLPPDAIGVGAISRTVRELMLDEPLYRPDYAVGPHAAQARGLKASFGVNQRVETARPKALDRQGAKAP